LLRTLQPHLSVCIGFFNLPVFRWAQIMRFDHG